MTTYSKTITSQINKIGINEMRVNEYEMKQYEALSIPGKSVLS